MDAAIIVCMVSSLLLLLVCIVLVFKKHKEINLEPIIIRLITEAEKAFKSGEGAQKFDYVFDKLYNNFAPRIVKILFSADEIKFIIQAVFDKVKIALDYREEQE